MAYRTKTYIAGDWTGDKDLIDTLYYWNNSQRLTLSFFDAHEITQARDTSLPCSIKKSLAVRLDASKTFVLIVGETTNSLTKGSCRYCSCYNSHTANCAHGMHIDYRSFIQYECQKAANDGLKIVVLYNATHINRNKCPEVLRYKGQHVAAMYRGIDGELYWDYQSIKNAIMS
ncbi:MAG: molecular chaperone Tir [Clostridia bacterium]|nr:molecular chaperone Tir [Clostridia bacterium]